MKIESNFNYGEKVMVNWYENECPPSKAVIIGINCNPKVDTTPSFTIMEDDSGMVIDHIDECMLEKILI